MSAAAAASSPITLLYVRDPDAEPGPIDGQLEALARRFPQVTLVVIDGDAVPAVIARRGPVPALLVMRGGELVGEATGSLPPREIEEVVRNAVEWPPAA